MNHNARMKIQKRRLASVVCRSWFESLTTSGLIPAHPEALEERAGIAGEPPEPTDDG